jgi:histidyl-tRNA synthetase
MVLTKIGKNEHQHATPVLFFVALDEPARIWAFLKANELRQKGICAEVDYLGRSVKSQMREANRQQTHYVIVLGEHELKTKTAKLKNMRTGEETSVSLDDIKIPS